MPCARSKGPGPYAKGARARIFSQPLVSTAREADIDRKPELADALAEMRIALDLRPVHRMAIVSVPSLFGNVYVGWAEVGFDRGRGNLLKIFLNLLKKDDVNRQPPQSSAP